MSRKLIRQMLASQTLSALTVSICLLIDNIMITRFLGLTAISAYELSNPLLLSIGAFGGMLSAGIQVTCSKSLGSGSQEETNRGYSTAVIISLAVSVLFTSGVLIFVNFLARAMGAGVRGEVHDYTVNYIVGFVIGAPGSIFALILVPFLIMSGKNNLLIAAVSGMTVADILFDFLNVVVFKGGMFGMGLASSISYYVAVAIGIRYFFSRKCPLRFSFARFSFRKALELFRNGIPTAVGMASSIILVFFLNRLFLRTGGHMAVAAYGVVGGITGASNCISTGVNGVSLTLSGILYHEEDRRGLKSVLYLLFRYGFILGFCVGAVLAVFAPFFVSVFIPEAGETRSMAILGVRLFAAGLIPCCAVNALKSFYQGTSRVIMTEIISFLEGAVLPCLAAFLLQTAFGLDGIWLQFAAGEILTLSLIVLYTRLRRRGNQRTADALMMLDPSFGVDDDSLMEAEIRSLEDVSSVSEAAERFCESHGNSALFAGRIALCIEEMAANTVSYGFSSGSANRLSVRLQHKGSKWTLRFRDDCPAFNPLSYVPPEGTGNGMGIRLMTAMADEVHYTSSLNLNNLTLVFDGEGRRGPGRTE